MMEFDNVINFAIVLILKSGISNNEQPINFNEKSYGIDARKYIDCKNIKAKYRKKDLYETDKFMLLINKELYINNSEYMFGHTDDSGNLMKGDFSSSESFLIPIKPNYYFEDCIMEFYEDQLSGKKLGQDNQSEINLVFSNLREFARRYHQYYGTSPSKGLIRK